MHFLDIAAAIKPKIEILVRNNDASDLTLKGYLLLKAQAEKNGLNIDEVIDIKRQEVEGITRLSESPEVDEGANIYLVNAALAAELMYKRLAIGAGSIDCVTLQDGGEQPRVCTTCIEFLAAKDAGYWPLTQFDMNCFGMADRTCEALRAITQARYAPASAIRYPRVDCKNLNLWSSDWLSDLFIDPDEHRRDLLSNYPTIALAIEAGHCNLNYCIRTSFDVNNDSMGVRVTELFRADMDDDGEEEIVVFRLAYATSGTLRAGIVCLAKPNRLNGVLHSTPIRAS